MQENDEREGAWRRILLSGGAILGDRVRMGEHATDSGVFIRCSDPKTINAMNAYEVNIYDKRPDPAYRTGAIVDVAKPSTMINTAARSDTDSDRCVRPTWSMTRSGPVCTSRFA